MSSNALPIVASIMVSVLLIFAISFTLRSFAKKITAPIHNSAPIRASLSAADATPRVLQTRFVSGYIFVRASVVYAGQSRTAAWFMLDSGTTSCLLSYDYAAQAGIRATGSTELSSGTVSRVGTASVDGFAVAALGGSALLTQPQVVTILDDDSVIQSIVGGQHILAENYGGILGVPFLREFNLLIDYQRERVIATRRPLAELGAPTAVVPISLVNPVNGKPEMTVPVLLNGQPAGQWVLDLGSDSSIVTQAVSERLGLKAGAPFQQLSLSDATITSGSATVTLSLGPALSSKQLVVDLPDAPIQALNSYGGDLATDYFRLLGKIGISVQQSEIYLY